ncbi:MAG: AmmeMemoRadiSam system protein B, partial [Sedimentisphaerales bacterium]|nr:AmmeMemoRadiSam system protein B [Sedimentisphaerales bacterium]
MTIRTPAVAGRFYEASPQACRDHIARLLPAKPIQTDLSHIIAGVVPHAGWVFSGNLAAMVFAAIKQLQSVDTFVLFGAMHSGRNRLGLLFDAGVWQIPLGDVAVDESLAQAIVREGGNLIRVDRQSHEYEHSIEVQIPIIRYLFPDARIVPILVGPVEEAPDIGRAVGKAVGPDNRNIACIASTDLTHYGPSYGCTPMGTGPEGIRWAKETNDQFFIDLVLKLQPDRLVDAANTYGNACGGGAVAA